MSGVLGYVLTSAFWSVVGAAVGYRYGSMSRDIKAMKEKLHMDPEAPAEPITESKHWLSRPSWTQIAGAVVVLLAVISTISTTIYSHRLNTVSRCLNAYVDNYNAVLRDRDSIGDNSRNNLREFVGATRDMVVGVTKLAPSPGEQPTAEQRQKGLALLTHFSDQADATIISLDQATQARKQYPLPANTCDDQLPRQ